MSCLNIALPIDTQYDKDSKKKTMEKWHETECKYRISGTEETKENKRLFRVHSDEDNAIDCE